MSDQNDQRMKRRVILAMVLAILLILALVYCHREPVKPEPARPEPAVPEAVHQVIPPPPKPKPVEPPPPPPEPPKPVEPPPEPPKPVEPPPPPKPPEPPPEPPKPVEPPPPPPKPPEPPPKIDPVIRFVVPAGASVIAATAETDDAWHRPVDMVGGTTITGQDRVGCRMTVLVAGHPLEYYFRLRKPAGHTVWEITFDDAWRPKLTVDTASGRKALPGLRIERQFFWTRRGIP